MFLKYLQNLISIFFCNKKTKAVTGLSNAVIERITAAEQQAAQTLVDAQLASREILAEGQRQAANAYDAIWKEAHAALSAAVTAAKEAGAARVTAYGEESQLVCERLSADAHIRLPAAVTAVLERIV